MVSYLRIDEKDLILIKMLKENSRTPYSHLAKQLGLSDVAIINRIKKLEKVGLIKRYTIEIDETKLGFKSFSYTGVDVDPEKLFDTVNWLKEKDYVTKLFITSGDHNIMCLIRAKDSQTLAKIHDEIAKLPGVRRVCPSMVLETVKE